MLEPLRQPWPELCIPGRGGSNEFFFGPEMSPPMSTEAENTQATGGSFPRPTVLVIDDEPLIRWSLGEAIREAGYAVRAAATGADAKAVLATLAGQPLVIVLDLRLPDVVDLSLLRTL